MSFGPSVGEPGYLPYCGQCAGLIRMARGIDEFVCRFCGNHGRTVNGEDMFDRTAPASVDRSPEGGDRETGRHAKHESAASEAGDAPLSAPSLQTPQGGDS